MSLFQSERPALMALVAVAAASGMALLGVRLFRVPVEAAPEGAPATLAASGTALCEPQEDDLLVLSLPRSEDAEAPSEPEPADSPSLETIETR